MRRSFAFVGAAVAAVAGWKVFERWHRSWGATDGELVMELPGDELTAAPVEQSTRAVTVDATPHDVWPWVVQLGADRGGFYSYDWLENLFGLEIHSATAIVPDWQRLEVGDMVYSDNKRTSGWIVVKVVPDEALVMKQADMKAGRAMNRNEGLGFEFQWTFALRPLPAGGTRLLVRERVAYGRWFTRRLMAPVGLVSFVMTRRMLLGITQRAESTTRRRRDDVDVQITEAPTLPPAWFKHLFWRVHRFGYRLLGARVLWTPATKRGWGAMHLTTIGRHSGERRGVILGYVEDGPTPVVLAMNGWDEGEPAWWLNLEANPEAVIRLKGQPECPVRARRVEGDERDRLWRRWAEIDEGLDAYAASRSADTPVVVFEPISP